MPIPNLSKRDEPLGPLRDKYAVTVADLGGEDFTLPEGFICQVGSAGNLAYYTLEGDEEQREEGLSEGDTINVGGVACLLRQIVVGANTTVTSFVVGRP